MSNTAITATFLENLRNETDATHKALEALPVSASILKPDVTNAEYISYLLLMRDVVKDAEENILPALSPIVSDLELRNKTHFIEADLTALRAALPEYTKVFTAKTEAFSTAFAMGILYVIEGSSLGGRVILKNITNALGHNAESGAAYFTGYGPQTGSHWKTFLAELIQYEAQNNAESEIIAGANFAFNTIYNHLKGAN